jgi:hypothetical protein
MKFSLTLTRDRLVKTLRWVAMQEGERLEGKGPQSPVRFKRAAKRAAKRGFGERW